MRKPALPFAIAGFTLVEISIGVAILAIIGGIAYSLLINSTTLLAKNVSLNSSNAVLRSALDRIDSEVSQANGMPILINADGSAGSANGPAAGIVFDRYLGGPYVVTNPGSTGLAASAQSFEIKLATAALASPPIPQTNDVVSIGTGTTRPLVSSCAPAVLPAVPPAVQAVTVTLEAPLGQDIPWTTAVDQKAFLVHRKAIVVVPANGRNELRLYPNVETTSSACDLTTSFVVLNNEIGGQTGENTPFTIVTQNVVTFLNIALRVEDQQYNKALASKQANEFNTFLRVDAMVRPRNFLD